MRKFALLVFALFCLGIGSGKAQYWVLLNFNDTNGSTPIYSSLTLSGNTLFGMTQLGGVGFGGGDGNIFSIHTDGSNYKDLWDFPLVWVPFGPGGQGAYYYVYEPYGSLTLSGNKLYGMTWQGGTAGGKSGNIFSIDTNGTSYNDLYEMQNGIIGFNPLGDVTLSKNKLYGRTQLWEGTIFSINSDGSGVPVLIDTNIGTINGDLTLVGGLLYGMAQGGGANGYGCIFSIDTNGSGFRDLYDFNGANQVYPAQALTYTSGKLYGMTGNGGAKDSGNIFSIDTNGSNYKDLFDFSGPDGKNPCGWLTLSGNRLYGMTPYGGQKNQGVVFSIDTDGTGFRDMYYFNNEYYGYSPNGSLTVSGGSLYGMTTYGGPYHAGVIFKLDTGAVASINTVTTSKDIIKVFPNPSNGIFTISMSNEEAGIKNIEVINVLGEQVYSHYQITKSSYYQIDLSSQPSGIYFLKLQTADGGTLVKKVEVVK